MSPISREELQELLRILIPLNCLRDEDTRRSRLIYAGLGGLLPQLRLWGDSLTTIPILVNDLIRIGKVDQENLAIACFLEAIIELLRPENDVSKALKKYLDKFQNVQPGPNPPPFPPRVRIDPEVMIISYDLTEMVAPLCKYLDHHRGGCGGFVLNANYEGREAIIDKFILARLRNEIRRKTPREVTPPYKISITPNESMAPEGAIERILLKQTHKNRLEEVLTLDKQDILIYVKNHYVPEEKMSRCVSAFWERLNTLAGPVIANQGRNLIMICVNAALKDESGSPLLPEEFIRLTPPKKLDPQDLSWWVKSYLQQMNIDELIIQDYIERISYLNGRVVDTYLALQEIVEDFTIGNSWRMD